MSAFCNKENNNNSYNNEKSKISTCKCIFFLRDLFLFDDADTSQGERRMLGVPQGSEHPEEGLLLPVGGGVGCGSGGGFGVGVCLICCWKFSFCSLL